MALERDLGVIDIFETISALCAIFGWKGQQNAMYQQKTD